MKSMTNEQKNYFNQIINELIVMVCDTYTGDSIVREHIAHKLCEIQTNELSNKQLEELLIYACEDHWKCSCKACEYVKKSL